MWALSVRLCWESPEKLAVFGIDYETVLETDNAHPPFGIRGDLEMLPFPSNYFDVVVSQSVVEHLKEPKIVFAELHRVLRPRSRW